ncbi:unnamed protein product [Vicia faba]|uniref:Uncharacterized protein n=1 Tax=Vicia faba TaxID=3906 RepID=A0AAV1A6N3_VICFA|nr:unnamed protein product [Vicia faba]
MLCLFIFYEKTISFLFDLTVRLLHKSSSPIRFTLQASLIQLQRRGFFYANSLRSQIPIIFWSRSDGVSSATEMMRSRRASSQLLMDNEADGVCGSVMKIKEMRHLLLWIFWTKILLLNQGRVPSGQ